MTDGSGGCKRGMMFGAIVIVIAVVVFVLWNKNGGFMQHVEEHIAHDVMHKDKDKAPKSQKMDSKVVDNAPKSGVGESATHPSAAGGGASGGVESRVEFESDDRIGTDGGSEQVSH